MREIKFRAKRKSDGKWVYGAYHKHLPYTPAPIRNEPVPKSDYEHCIIQDGFSDWNLPRGFRGYEIDPETVGQYTALKDKNGTEIYEGDIVKFWSNGIISAVVWHNAGFILQGGHLTLADMFKSEVIGNTYENPELLK